MAQFFNAAEIANAAVEIETRGQAFYLRVANAAKSAEAKTFFEYFAGEEAKHKGLFEALAKRLGPMELPAWSTKEEYADYLAALLDTHALFSGGLAEKLMAEAADESTAIRLAMSFEKDTILFFMEMKELVPDSEKPFLDLCIHEERAHLKMLRGRLAKA